MKRIILLLTLGGLLCATPVTFTGCANLRPVPVAIEEGQDPVIVNAQRIQRSSLEIYHQVISWEMQNRNALPVGVSRAVDKYRAEFKPAWELSRKALADYEAKRGVDATTLGRITAALSAAQTALMSLQANQSNNEIAQAGGAIVSLVNSVSTLVSRQPNP